jgi:hypothetical protein
MNQKSLFKSRTFWVNSLTFAATAVTYVVDNQVFSNPDVVASLVSALAFVNIGLRLLTKDSVTIVTPK